ncbi:unnamed protein product [Tetraodon nigroviridis]|uniref:(spotted green pufferfish) hypothetical protein n=1 Tax=Tetraodon nigroviridis TaxID=99883 RepID=Q4THB1_TETNG|nr:unnamed protein product [Tetraodon nigroviridis]
MVTAAFTDVPPARRFPSDRTWNLLSLPQVRQLDVTVLSLKSQSAAAALELENAALRRELEAQKERSGVRGVPAAPAASQPSPHRLPVLPEVLGRTRTGAAGEPPAGERSAEDADVPTVLAAHRHAAGSACGIPASGVAPPDAPGAESRRGRRQRAGGHAGAAGDPRRQLPADRRTLTPSSLSALLSPPASALCGAKVCVLVGDCGQTWSLIPKMPVCRCMVVPLGGGGGT